MSEVVRYAAISKDGSLPRAQAFDGRTIYEYFNNNVKGTGPTTDANKEKWTEFGKRYDKVARLIEEAMAVGKIAFEGKGADAMQNKIAPVVAIATQAKGVCDSVALQVAAQGDHARAAQQAMEKVPDVPPEPWLNDFIPMDTDFDKAKQAEGEAVKRNQERFESYRGNTQGTVDSLPQYQFQPQPELTLDTGNGNPGEVDPGRRDPGRVDPPRGLPGQPGRFDPPGGVTGGGGGGGGGGGTGNDQVRNDWNIPAPPPVGGPPLPQPIPGPGPLPGPGPSPLPMPVPPPGFPPGGGTPPGGGSGRGGSGGFGPRGSGGAFGPGGSGGQGGIRGGFGPGGSAGIGADAHGAAGRGGAGGAGARGAAGAPGGPMGAGAGNRGEEDKEHRRPEYLIETEDIFGDIRTVAPPVIGESGGPYG
ncbi:hypothetical protein M8C13_22390 [Crossiella sp. SN42]|uniref:hypothetical protein n=1 Tax=Crossiella sp. SN42 TaxID=2944808 RepID=UPI00207C9C92|nr:hypothetical protein [Crossiella sp. SN42]MCO1578506.1 hypothetical protein [Crossiella sp. SN42]